MNISLLLRGLILFLSLWILTFNFYGCQEGTNVKVVYYNRPQKKVKKIKKVVIFPFKNFSPSKFAGVKVRNLVGLELLRIANIDYVPFSNVDKGLILAGYQPGSDVPISIAKDIANQYKADAFIIGMVNHYEYVRKSGLRVPYVDISLQVYDASTGNLIWAGKAYDDDVALATKLFGVGLPTMSDVSLQIVDTLIYKMLGQNTKTKKVKKPIIKVKVTNQTNTIIKPEKPVSSSSYIIYTPSFLNTTNTVNETENQINNQTLELSTSENTSESSTNQNTFILKPENTTSYQNISSNSQVENKTTLNNSSPDNIIELDSLSSQTENKTSEKINIEEKLDKVFF